MTASFSTAIVLLEDSDLDAELIVARLLDEELQLPVRRAADEASYLALLEAGHVALILSDFSLPGYDGRAALDAAHRLAPATPFIFVSGAIGEDLAIETIRRGATDYVLKHRLDRLGPAVRRALAEADTRKRRDAAEAERDRLLLSERSAREVAEAANRMKDEFLAVVSHELRTPLNAILGWSSLLCGSESDEPTRQRGLDVIVRNARAQARLIEDVLDISRIVSGKLHLQLLPTPIEGFVTAAVDSTRPAAAARSIRLEVSIDPDVGEMLADADRLQQVVWNLVANAVKFTPPSGTVRVAARRRGESLRIEVADTGNGIDPDLLPWVFERFRQADSSKTRAHGGLGLGLAIVKHLVEMHGGTVSASSGGLGAGATFAVELPLRSTPVRRAIELTAPASGEQPSTAPPPGPGLADLSGLHILVVDDERDARELIEEVLRRSGAEVSTRSSVEEALVAIGERRPDVIVSDIGMPTADGYAFIRRLRALSADRGGCTPAIALTAYARDLDRDEAQRAGFQRYLSKPVAPQLLVAAVSEVAGR